MKDYSKLLGHKVKLTRKTEFEGHVCRHSEGGYCVQGTHNCMAIDYNDSVVELPKWWPPLPGDIWSNGHAGFYVIQDWDSMTQPRAMTLFFVSSRGVRSKVEDATAEVKLLYREGVTIE